MFKKTLESDLDGKEVKPVNPKGNQSWIFIGRTDAEYEAPTLWPLYVKDWLIIKDSDTGKDWRQEEKGMTRGWDGLIASPTWWTWVWASSGSWWWTGKPGVLQSMGSQRLSNWHDAKTQLSNWNDLKSLNCIISSVGESLKGFSTGGQCAHLCGSMEDQQGRRGWRQRTIWKRSGCVPSRKGTGRRRSARSPVMMDL